MAASVAALRGVALTARGRTVTGTTAAALAARGGLAGVGGLYTAQAAGVAGLARHPQTPLAAPPTATAIPYGIAGGYVHVQCTV